MISTLLFGGSTNSVICTSQPVAELLFLLPPFTTILSLSFSSSSLLHIASFHVHISIFFLSSSSQFYWLQLVSALLLLNKQQETVIKIVCMCVCIRAYLCVCVYIKKNKLKKNEKYVRACLCVSSKHSGHSNWLSFMAAFVSFL